MFQFFDKLGYPVSFAQVDHYHVQKIDRQSALPKAQKENGDRIQFTLTFHLTTTQLNLSFRTWGSLHCIRFDPLHRHHFCVAQRPTRQEALPDLFESNPVQRTRCLLILANKVSDLGTFCLSQCHCMPLFFYSFPLHFQLRVTQKPFFFLHKHGYTAYHSLQGNIALESYRCGPLFRPELLKVLLPYFFVRCVVSQ